MTTSQTNRYTATLAKLEKFINRFISFSDAQYSLPVALWTICTFLYPDFDAFPYMVITSDTKRSGKTRLAEILSFACSNPVNSGAMSPAAIYKTMADEQPTIFFDEAETLNSEAANVMRSVLNMGYRKGSVIRRVLGNQVQEYQTYCPKVFILIGDVYDTLKDRSMVIRMKRGEPKERFVYETAKTEGATIREEIAKIVEETRFSIIEKFTEFKGIKFLTDRDEEIWTPLFVVASVLCPERIKELSRAAVDMSTEKTMDSRRYVNLLGEEEKARDDEYAQRLLVDMVTVINGEKHVTTVDVIRKLWELETSPWRKFKGEGLTLHNLADMLSRFGVRPCNIQIGTGRKNRKIVKGYKLADVKKAIR